VIRPVVEETEGGDLSISFPWLRLELFLCTSGHAIWALDGQLLFSAVWFQA